MAARLSALLARHGEDLFVPLTFGLARRMEQASWQEFVDDPGLATFAINAARKALQADGVINWFDGWLEAESAGMPCVRDADGRVDEPPFGAVDMPSPDLVLTNPPARAALDVATRLCRQIDESGIVIGYVTGLATLAERIGGAGKSAAAVERAAEIMLAMAKAYLEAGVSALLLAEEAEAPASLRPAFEALRPLFNLAEYYETPVILLPRRSPDPGIASALSGMGARIAAKGGDRQIIVLPIGDASPDVCLNDWRNGDGDRRRLVLSGWDVATDSAPEDVVAVAQQIKRH